MRWSQNIKSNAMDIPHGLFTWKDSKKIARVLKQSSDSSKRTKGTKFSSAMSMLNLYINRAGSNLNESQKNILNDAKKELRILYNKPSMKL